MGTPHRGSNYANLGQIACNITITTEFNANRRNVRALELSSEILENLTEEFILILENGEIRFFIF